MVAHSPIRETKGVFITVASGYTANVGSIAGAWKHEFDLWRFRSTTETLVTVACYSSVPLTSPLTIS
ncbi:hypothetical protein LX32DRAFT_641590 [Colletotrichum zoysiae]|uniref:Uncharacterized protein n=1 Tax=Colletotrichum zoysiae TaxID=1216348 RepID=A0AAD9HF26_9PEZI|nr:hypothetical protein LX32DRAFT_641590 [Colletotrichum zoysiae]